MAIQFNTQQTLVKGAYGQPFDQGFAKDLQALRYYSKDLITPLDAGSNFWAAKHVKKYVLPANFGSVIEMRRYVPLPADPNTMQIERDSITGPGLKALNGVAVEARVTYFGSGIAFNYNLIETGIDPYFALGTQAVMKQIDKFRDNLIHKEIFAGASRVYVKSYDPTAAFGTPSVTLGSNPVLVDTAGPLCWDVLLGITTLMDTHTQTYTPLSGHATQIPAQIEKIGGYYRLGVNRRGKKQLLADPKFIEAFKYTSSPLSYGDAVSRFEIPTYFDIMIEEGENFPTLNVTATASEAELRFNSSGNRGVAFLVGNEYGATVNLASSGLKMYTKTTDQNDSTDTHGLLAYIAWRLPMTAKVLESAACYAVVYNHAAYFTGNIVPPSNVEPKS